MAQIAQAHPRFLVYDCFSNTRFGGNIGGIVLDAGHLSDTEMQGIAGEINAPVTGFVTAQDGHDITARFFMPGAEIAMCGHVTVGLFTYLTRQAGMKTGAFTLHAKAGDVRVKVSEDDGGLPDVLMQMSLPTLAKPNLDPQALAAALGVKPTDIGAANPLESADAGMTHLCVQLETLAQVKALSPDFKALGELCKAAGLHTVGCFSMQTENPKNTLYIRDFCPALGVDEVPASGTTNGALAGYLVRHGLVPSGIQSVLAEQGYDLGRPSQIRSLITSQDGAASEIWIGGQAVASLQGHVAGAE